MELEIPTAPTIKRDGPPTLDPNFAYPPGVLSPWEFAFLCLEMEDLYGWQIVALEAYGQGLPVALCAANGSGKTQRVIAVAILWQLTYWPRSVIPVTSGSWTQLEHQLWPALERHAGRFSHWRWMAMRVLTDQGGEAFAFSTNEPGRAEGYHGSALEPVGYIIDEAKTVPNGIYNASNRCTCQFRIVSSSAGGPMGFFFDCFHKLRSEFFTRRVTSEECAHLRAKFERDCRLYPHDDPDFRSMHFSDFGIDVDFIPIINPMLLRRLYESRVGKIVNSRSAFCDFAAGGAENVIALRDGNEVSLARCWRETDTAQAVRQFIEEFKRLKLVPTEIFGDEGGLGHNMCDSLAEAGWRINRVNNGAPALDSEHYCNLGAEAWFTAARKIERREVILPNDPIFFEQATTRKLEYDSKQRMRAQDKKTMAKSPDRADAVFGALYSAESPYSREMLSAAFIPPNPFDRSVITF
jgi:phage terminase large subunit